MEVYRTSASSLGRQPLYRPPQPQGPANRARDLPTPQPTSDAPSPGIPQCPREFQAGSGIMKRTPDGDIYEGGFKDGKRHGEGKITWPDGSTYEGGWVNGEKHGTGTYTWPDGSKYVGGFKNGKMRVPKTMTTPDGCTY